MKIYLKYLNYTSKHTNYFFPLENFLNKDTIFNIIISIKLQLRIYSLILLKNNIIILVRIGIYKF